MATRSLTEVFILMRNNALQNRHLFSDQVSFSGGLTDSAATTPATPEGGVNDDRVALMSKDRDIELGSSQRSRLPPEWIDGVEEVQYEVSKIKQKMRELASVHDKHLNRPTLDDSMDEEHAIEIHTQEITQMFSRCQRLVQQINQRSRFSSLQEQKLTLNVVSSLARTLQELSNNFRKSQSTYLRKLKSREERSKQYFDTDLIAGASGFTPGQEEEIDLYDRGFTDNQLQEVEDNSMVVVHREKEITQIVRSINDLNEIFKDLATMIVDQGTILDRIDYNIETTSTHVEKGLQQLQKAEKYQKKSRKMYIIIILFIIVIILIISLIAKKSLS